MAPARVLEEWMNTDAAYRAEEEAKMKAAWDEWMQSHRNILTGPTAGAGKTKQISAEAVSDVKNDIMMFSIVEAASHDDVAEQFKNHPHFGIPEATIQIMPAHFMPGMEGM
jgi:hypothetical protein